MVNETKIGPHVKNGNLHGKINLYWLVNIIVLCVGHRVFFFFFFPNFVILKNIPNL
jgi:hypothetical protein